MNGRKVVCITFLVDIFCKFLRFMFFRDVQKEEKVETLRLSGGGGGD